MAQAVERHAGNVGRWTDVTENVVSTLLNWGKKFRVTVPSRAKSNGTLIALAGQSIVMGANSELGPIAPSLNGMPCTFIQEAAKAGPIDPILLQAANHAILQTKKLAPQVLKDGMMSTFGEQDINEVVGKLASRETYHSHWSVIDHSEAARLGLNVEYLPPDDVVWQKL